MKKRLIHSLIASCLLIGGGTASAAINTSMKVSGKNTQLVVNIQGEGATSPLVQLSFLHLAKPGESLYSIAKKYGVPLNDLLSQNKLKASQKLLVNQRIIIPVKKKVSNPAPNGGNKVQLYIVVDEKSSGTGKSSSGAAKSSSKVAKSSSVPSKANERKHLVKNGETLYSIAQSYGFTVKQILDYNRLNPQVYLKAGQTIQIPKSSKPVIHTVASGESLTKIARVYKTTVSQLVQYNQLKNGNGLLVGQKLKIPV